MSVGFFHQPVLLQSVCSTLEPRPGKRFLDVTIGGAGHTRSLLNKGARVLGLDQDPEAIAHLYADAALQPALAAQQLVLEKANFLHSAEMCKKHNFVPIDGLIADLGVSSYQFDNPQRGFSYRQDGPLDMRMDPLTSLPVSEYLNCISEIEIARVLDIFGEIPQAKSLAHRIATSRPLGTTRELAQLIPEKQIAQVFQAFRIAVNDELGALHLLLDQTLSLCHPGTVICIITFHSLEDRIVKRTFQDWSLNGKGHAHPLVEPDTHEITQNNRSRSSKLRVFTINHVS